MHNRKHLFITLFMTFFASLSAQKAVKICGEYTYNIPDDISRGQAKKIAIERAKIEALATQFGRTVLQKNATVMKSENNVSDVRFLSLGGSEVKGEWLEDIGEPQIEIIHEGDMMVMKVSNVCGKAREIKSLGVDFSAKTLRNGTETKNEDDEFRNGDEIFLSFRSPVDGNLVVYLVDESLTAYCLLPYLNDKTGRTKIKGGADYIFFSPKHVEKSEKTMVDEYELTCEKAIEHNFLYVIFSTNDFFKANDTHIGEPTLPRTLDFKDFQKWLTNNRIRDNSMTVQEKILTIKK